MLNGFYNELISNFQLIGIVFIIFVIAVLSNIITSSFYNIKTLKEKFSLARLIEGVIKMLIIGITTGLLAMIATALPYMFSFTGIDFTEEMKQLYTVIAILGLYANGICKYYKESFMTIKDIIDNKNIIEDINEELIINFDNREEEK